MLLHPGVLAELATQRRESLLQRANADRRLAHAVIRNRAGVQLRPINAGDARLLRDGFARLSRASREARFLGPKNALTPAEVRYLTDVDHHDHEAIVAVSRSDGRGLGVARYIRDPDEPTAAELAVTISDDWQHRGLGTRLVTCLSDRALAEGVRRFTALVRIDNVGAQRLLDRVGGATTVLERDVDSLTLAVELARPRG